MQSNMEGSSRWRSVSGSIHGVAARKAMVHARLRKERALPVLLVGEHLLTLQNIGDDLVELSAALPPPPSAYRVGRRSRVLSYLRARLALDEAFCTMQSGTRSAERCSTGIPTNGPCSSREACPWQYRRVHYHDDRWASSAGHRSKVTGGLPSSLRPSTRGVVRGSHGLARPIASRHAGLVRVSALQPFSSLEPTKRRLASSRGRHIAKHCHKHFYCLRHQGRREWRTEAPIGPGARCTGCVLLWWFFPSLPRRSDGRRPTEVCLAQRATLGGNGATTMITLWESNT
ncbi:hypothetical protein KC365_g25 [Hortaea werneckii]|nr:hypothetical protein KC365_g25 [Hortaea werneckii]